MLKTTLNHLSDNKQAHIRAIMDIVHHECRSFQRLKKACIEARYFEHYEISAEELEWLADRVAVLKNMAQQRCTDKMQMG